jgi:glycosyltransferase involved in cell wall biosynthesis
MKVRQRALTAKREEKIDAQGDQLPTPRFSVIICTYNRRNFVLATLACLRRQEFPYTDFEVIVVDNGSQDGTLNAINAFVKIDEGRDIKPETNWRIRCLSEPRIGLVHARNTGLLAARGEIAVFVDDDTLVDSHMLEYLWQSYQETGADAIGMHVKVHWDMVPPHWIVRELLDVLGCFSLNTKRVRLAPNDNFASCAFSVKISVLRDINYFTPFLSKRPVFPASAEVADLCWKLHQAGYKLWYEPQALVLHRVTTTRLKGGFFMGRAYWQGRAEIIQHYRHTSEDDKTMRRETLRELGHFAYCFFLQNPLVRLAGRPTSERMLASMEQAHSWGRVIQRLLYLGHIPPELEAPSVFLVHDPAPNTSFSLLTQALNKQELLYLMGEPEISLGWLWRHRAYRNQAFGVLHFYQPGALELTYRQSQRLHFRLWLARCLGIRVVVTDNGGWWQSMRGASFHRRRALERKLLHASHAIISATNQPKLLYRDRRLRQSVRCLPQPGFRGHYPPARARDEARAQLGITSANFVYLCFAHHHTEREIVFLLEAFSLLTLGSRHMESLPNVHLLVVGEPVDKSGSVRILKLALRNPQIHIHTAKFSETDLPLYIGACNVQVLPHLAVHTSGLLENANLALSCNLLVIVPDLPRFSGILPQQASLPYVPGSRESLAQALLQAQQMSFSLHEEESLALDAEQSWSEYAQHLLDVYRQLLMVSPDEDYA